MHKLSDTIERKFIDIVELTDWEIDTPTGWYDCTHLNQTIEYEVYEIIFESGNSIKVADTHIFINEFGQEVFAQNCLNLNIQTRTGPDKVTKIIQTNAFENMYDITVDSDEHTYYSNNIVSHNTTSVAAYILHYILFSDTVPTVAIVGHKAAGAREVMQRLQLMYEYIPKWMQKGIKTWNKGNIVLEGESGADGAQVFTGATTASGLRSKSCVTGDTKICIEENNCVFYIEIDKIINNSRLVNIKDSTMKCHTVYKTTNKINNKIYVGVHSIHNRNEIKNFVENGSIFKDGYLGSGDAIVRAVKKYGPENFKQELLQIFETRKLAEDFESSIVTKDFVLNDNTYNIAVGGKITFNNKQFSQSRNFKIHDLSTGVTYIDMRDAMVALNISTKSQLRRRVWEGVLKFDDEILQKETFEYFESLLSKEEKSKLLADLARERFTGVPQTEEHKMKRGIAVSEWIKNNPELHLEKMNKINKNPQKISKTANTHTGMKRSDFAKLNMSLNSATKGKPARNNGKVLAYDPVTNNHQWFNNINEIPNTWIKGLKKKGGTKRNSRCYNDGIKNRMFMSDPGEGWILGRIKC